eukprot:2728678-Pleurochrysis_carterae.AAC.1
MPLLLAMDLLPPAESRLRAAMVIERFCASLGWRSISAQSPKQALSRHATLLANSCAKLRTSTRHTQTKTTTTKSQLPPPPASDLPNHWRNCTRYPTHLSPAHLHPAAQRTSARPIRQV